jgi:hypothetical protein
VQRIRLLAGGDRQVDAARDHADVARAQLPRVRSERARGADHQASAPEQGTRRARRAPRQLDVRSPQLDDDGLPRRERDAAGGQPVCVDEVGAGRGRPGRSDVGGDERRRQRGEPRPPAEVSDDARPVRQAKVGEVARRHDVDVDAAAAHVLDRVGDEAAGRVAGEAGIRGGENRNLQADARRRENTSGAVTASSASA